MSLWIGQYIEFGFIHFNQDTNVIQCYWPRIGYSSHADAGADASQEKPE